MRAVERERGGGGGGEQPSEALGMKMNAFILVPGS